MKRKIFSKLILAGLCAIALAGCGKQATDESRARAQNTVPSQTSNENSSYGTADNISEMLDSATLNGSVLDFTDNGCSVSPAKLIENGAGAQISADGYENEDTAVTVNYNSDCTFVIATLNGETNSITNIIDGSASDVKKQSQIFVYGDYADAYTLNADKVIIARYE